MMIQVCRSSNPVSGKTRCVACHCLQTQPLDAELPRECVDLRAEVFCFSFIQPLHHTRFSSKRCVAQTLTIKLAAELFNWTIECGLDLADTKAQAVIRVGSIEEVASVLLDRILFRLAGNALHRNPAYQVPPSDFEQRFRPFVPMLDDAERDC